LLLQFHAEPHDLASWVSSWRSSWGLRMVVERFNPVYAAEDVDEILDELPASANRVMLSPRPMNKHTSSSLGFVSMNDNFLLLSPGPRTDSSLGESTIQTIASDPEVAKLWRSIVRSTKRSMHTGATAVNPITMATANARGHHYTDSALESARRGIRMLAIGNFIEYRFDG
jgi:hypothetical protein